ncbi:MAG TPA: hypothetical protein ENI69_09935 [Rhodospirillales bacterium]|nr:hypothetical protein [Rhodospirillales bacterium]
MIYLLGPVGGLESLAHARLRERALALAPQIKVNGICGGPVVAHNEQWSSLSLSPKVPTADIVSTVRFILDTGAITGQVIALGGRLKEMESL